MKKGRLWLIILLLVTVSACVKPEPVTPSPSPATTEMVEENVNLQALNHHEIFAKGALEHIFYGNINSKGEVVGYHYEGLKEALAHAEKPGKPDEHGVYTAKVYIGEQPKTSNNGYSSFYPKDLTPQEVVDLVYDALNNSVCLRDNTYSGLTESGIEIRFYLNDRGLITSAYPIKEN